MNAWNRSNRLFASAMSVWSTWLLLPILVGALGTRMWQLGRESLWFDEIYTAELAQRPVSEIALRLLRWGVDPPLHYYAVWAALRGFGALGVEIAARLPSVMAGTLAVAALYMTARHLWSRPAGTAIGLIAAGAFALAPFQGEYAQEARAYAFVVLWTSVAVCGLVWATGNPGPGLDARGWRHPGWVIWLLGATLALYTHYIAVLAVSGLALFGILSTLRLQRQRPPRVLLGSLIWLVSPFLLFIPWLAQAEQQFAQMAGRSSAGTGWLEPRMLSIALVKHMSYVLGAGAASPWRKVIPLLAMLGCVTMVARREWRGLWLTVLWFLPSVAFLLAMPVRPFPDRYLIIWAPTFLLLAARGTYALAELVVAFVRRPAYRTHVALLLGTVFWLALWLGLQHYYTVHKQDWRDAIRLVNASPPMPLYAPWMPSIACFYASNDPTHPALDSRDPAELQARLLAEPRAWLIVNQIQRAFDPEDKIADAWYPLSHVDLVFWGNLHLVYVGGQAKPSELIAEVERMELPPAAPVWLSLARAQRKIGDTEAARHTLHRAAEFARVDPSPQYLRDIAGEMRLLGLHEEAIELYRTALKRMPDDVETRLGLAVSATALQRPDEALQVLASLPRKEANKYWPQRLLGEAYRQKGQLAQALAHFAAAEKSKSTDADICVLLATTSDALSDSVGAVYWWQQYLERAPDGPFRASACQYFIEHNGPACSDQP